MAPNSTIASNIKKKESAPNFVPALAKARQDTAHIFNQASSSTMATAIPSSCASLSKSNSSSSSHSKLSSSSLESSKAAAWAWHQRYGGGASPSPCPPSPKGRRRRRRSSRFKAEAMRATKNSEVNAHGHSEAPVSSSSSNSSISSKWDLNHRLFDSYEILCVAKELDRALRLDKSSMLRNSKSLDSSSPSSSSKMKQLSKLAMCRSGNEAIVATALTPRKRSELGKVHPSTSSNTPSRRPSSEVSPSSVLSAKKKGKLSKAIHLFTYTPSIEDSRLCDLQHHHHEYLDFESNASLSRSCYV